MATTRAISIEDANLGQSGLATTQNRQYIDVDLSFAKKQTTGDVYKKQNAAAVKQAVKNLLLTNQNEKPFQPYFGANLSRFLFELADQDTSDDIDDEIRNVIEVYEPRVDLDTLEVSTRLLADYNSIEVTVVFQVINTNEVVNFTTVLSRLR